MSLEYFSISMADTNEPAKSLLPLNTPENARELPCEGCDNLQECGDQGLECVAIRSWYRLGDFRDEDLGRLRRAMK